MLWKKQAACQCLLLTKKDNSKRTTETFYKAQVIQIQTKKIEIFFAIHYLTRLENSRSK